MDSKILDVYGLVDVKLASLHSIIKPTVSTIVFAFAISWVIAHTIYNLCFHPLARFPGPKFAAASRIWWIYHTFRGTLSEQTLQLHIKYGSIVRIAPSEIVFVEPQAWNDIYGHRYGVADVKKDPREFINMEPNIVFSDRLQHQRYRKQFSHGFSDKAIREQEPLLQQYVETFIDRIGEQGEKGQSAFNISTWYSRSIADILSHLMFGESFGCLNAKEGHPFVEFISNAAYHLAFVRGLQRIPGTQYFLDRLVPPSLMKKRKALEDMIHAKLERRRARTLPYTDLVTNLLKSESEGDLTPVELESNAEITVIAGVETTESLLVGTTWYVLRHPEIRKKLVEEIRGSFGLDDAITATKANNLRYLGCCLEESLRIYCPAAVTLVRVTPPEGSTICGEYIPGDLNVGVNIYAAARYPGNWTEPMKYIPERWIGNKEASSSFRNDKRESLQPFSFGPRNCIGRGLAYTMVRLLLVNLFLRYDVELDHGMEDWSKQLIYGGFRRAGKPLMIKAKPVNQV